jgi:hypothetical protein
MSTRFFEDQRPTRQDPDAGATQGMSGTDTTQVNEVSVFRSTTESKAEPSGGPETAQPIPVPRLSQGQKHSTLSSILGGEEGAPTAPTEVGFGPRLVVIHDFITGPAPVKGGRRAAFTRGRVIWGSQLIGDELMKKAQEGDDHAIETLRRYARKGAVREATRSEANYTQITFVEGEAALTTNLDAAKQRLGETENENARLKQLLEALDLDPDATVEELQAAIAARNAASVVPPGDPGSGTDTGAGSQGTERTVVEQAPPPPSAPPSNLPPIEGEGTGGTTGGTGGIGGGGTMPNF